LRDRPLDGRRREYTLTFAKDGLPPVNAIWWVTMNDGKTQLLIANLIDRYLLDMKKNRNGSLTIRIQKEAPPAAEEANWLPAPHGPMFIVIRLYWPKITPPSILPPGSGTWSPPPIARVE
jgi:hypothetical protein